MKQTGFKVNSVNVRLGGAIKYDNIPTNRRGHKMYVRIGVEDEDKVIRSWNCNMTVITGLGFNETQAMKTFVEGCIKATDDVFNHNTIRLIKDVIQDHNNAMLGNGHTRYYFDNDNKIVERNVAEGGK